MGVEPHKKCREKPLPKYGLARYLTAGKNGKFVHMGLRISTRRLKPDKGERDQLANVLRFAGHMVFTSVVLISIFVYMCQRPFLKDSVIKV
jgi:hypothetical protein